MEQLRKQIGEIIDNHNQKYWDETRQDQNETEEQAAKNREIHEQMLDEIMEAINSKT